MKKILTVIAAFSLLFTSCNKWLDINYDPNAVTDVESGLILPSIELNALNVYGFYAHTIGSYFSEQLGIRPGGPNTMDQAQWNTQDAGRVANMGNRIYQYSYIRIINNAKTIRAKAAASGAWGDYLAATVYRAFAYQILVDCFGETPYSEAENTGISSPVYDDGKDVYAGIIADLDNALSKVSASDKVCDNMTFSSSNDVNNWIRFANALKLRMLMHEYDKVDVADKVADLIEEDNFPVADIKFAGCFKNQAGFDHPMYDAYVRAIGDAAHGRSTDLCGHLALLGTMNSYGDPRVPAKFNASVKYQNYEGNIIDSQQSVEQTSGLVDKDAFAEPALKYDSPVYIITVAETKFFIAEYYARIGNHEKAQEYYEAAVDASFALHGVQGADAVYGDGAPYAYDSEDFQKIISVQKWIALACVDGFESWNEIRRTGYPAFGEKTGKEIYTKWVELATANKAAGAENPTPTAADLVAAGVYTYGTIFTPSLAEEIPDNVIIGRLRYSISSSTANNKIPEQKSKDTKVFWAK